MLERGQISGALAESRLGRAGFTDTLKVSPGCWFIDMDSWHRHLIRCMENPEMWDEGSEDLETYRFYNGLGRREHD